eukprot:SAG31_NODE_1183_length_9510_cov_43.257040_3_plen_104_part_00
MWAAWPAAEMDSPEAPWSARSPARPPLPAGRCGVPASSDAHSSVRVVGCAFEREAPKAVKGTRSSWSGEMAVHAARVAEHQDQQGLGVSELKESLKEADAAIA